MLTFLFKILRVACFVFVLITKLGPLTYHISGQRSVEHFETIINVASYPVSRLKKTFQI